MGGVSSSLVTEVVVVIVCVGVKLAKNGFVIHGVDDVGKAGRVQARAPRLATRGVQPFPAAFDRLDDLLERRAPGSPCHRLNQREH